LTSLRPTAAATVALPGALTVYFAFNAGGFFVGSQAVVTLLLLVILVLRATTASDPFGGLSGPVAIAAAALAAYAAWVLASAAWSDAPSRALLEFDRALLYLTALVLFGSFVRTPERLRWMLRMVALAIVLVCGIALITRVLPDVWPVSPNLANDRLSYPITYWNALGLFAAFGVIFCLHLASSVSEPRTVRVLGSAAMPVLAVTLLFTFSRGAIVAAAAALLIYGLVGRSRALPIALLAVLPSCAMALAVAYGADQLATQHPTTSAAVTQGHKVAVAVALCAIAAGLLRWLLLRFDHRIALSMLPRLSPRARLGGVTGVVAAALVFAVIANAPAAIGRQYDHFVGHDSVKDGGDFRARLTDPSNSHRLELWRADLNAFDADRLTGHGAGTFQVIWTQQRPNASSAVDGHSLYLETLAELGVVGALLLLATLVTLLVGLARRCRGPDRPLYAALLAVAVAWALHAGVDWDWEMPVVTLWLFALGGAALAASNQRERLIARPPARLARVLIGIGALVFAVTPARVAVSQARLDASVKDFKRGNCTGAIDSALSSASALGARPEPYEVLGYCDSRLGQSRLALQSMRRAVERDPENWEFRYGLTVVRAVAGRDPRPSARATLRLDPRGLMAQDLVRRFRIDDPAAWRKRGRTAPLPGDLQ
jgi:O-antigen ligase